MSDLKIPLPADKSERLDAMNASVRSWAQLNGIREDAADSVAFARQLDEVRSRTFDVLYPQLKRNQFIPNVPIDPASETVTYRQFDQTGEAKLVQDYAHDFPNVEVAGAEFIRKVIAYGDSYQYSIQDLRASRKADFALDAKKAMAARQAIERKLEKLCALGEASALTNAQIPIYGFCNHPNINLMTGAGQSQGGSDLTGSWDSASTTVQQILDDLNKMQKKIVDQTQGEFLPDTLVLDLPVYTALATRQRSTVFTDDSILQYILKQSPWLKSIDFWVYLKTGATGSKSAALLYKKDPMVLEQRVAVEFEQFAPQPEGMTLKVHCHARHGGVVIPYPLAVLRADGLLT